MHEQRDEVMERIVINAADFSDDDTSESSIIATIMMIYKELVQSSVTANGNGNN